MLQQYEVIEITLDNKLLVSVNAIKYETVVRSFVHKCGLEIEKEEVQSVYNSQIQFDPDTDYCRAGFLYQALLVGERSALEVVGKRIVQIIKDVRLLERCFNKELTTKERGIG